jgi:hypothetical protein
MAGHILTMRAHAPILGRDLFEAVQGKLAAQAVERRCRLRGSPAVLSGRLFDDRGNRMTPSHTNKDGARYRYYISQAVLQKKPQASGLVSRVPAAEIEALVLADGDRDDPVGCMAGKWHGNSPANERSPLPR